MPPRVKRTYGRRDASEATTTDDLSTHKPSTLENISRHSKQPSDGVDQDDISRKLPGRFSDWRERLKDLDTDRDLEDENNPAVAPSSMDVQKQSTQEISNIVETQKADDSFSSEYNDSSTLVSIPPATTSSQSLPPSPEIVKKARRSAKPVTVLDSDEEPQVQSSPISTNPFPLATPKKQSSSPPTSDAENEATRPSANAERKTPDSESDGVNGNASSRSTLKAAEGKKHVKSKKVRKLSKKEEKESRKAHARLIADQPVQFTKKGNTRISVLSFFQTLNGSAPKKVLSSEQSDPILPFTSPPRNEIGPSKFPTADAQFTSELADGSDEELPDVSAVVKQQQQEDAAKKRREELLDIKRKATEACSRNSELQSASESDDLEIISNDKKGKHRQSGDLEKKLAPIAGFTMSKRTILSEVHPSSQDLRAAAKPAFERSRFRRGKSVDNKTLQETMLEKAAQQVQQITNKKESEWVRRGGKVKERIGLKDITEENVASKLAAKILEVKGDSLEPADGVVGDQMSEDSDGEWAPGNEDGSDLDDVQDADTQTRQDARMQSDADDSDGGQQEVPLFRRNLAKKFKKRTVTSDSDEETRLAPHGRVLVPDTSLVDIPEENEYQRQQALLHRGSRSSLEGSLPDDENKENDENLMFDNDEDKENNAVPRRFSSQNTAVSQRRPSSPNLSDDFSDKENGPVLRSSFGLEPPDTSIRVDSSSNSLNTTSPKSLQPAFGEGPSGFGQLFDEDEGFKIPAARDEDSRPVDSSSPELRLINPRGGLSQAFSPEEPRFFDRLKRPAFGQDLTLTLDSTLQPALNVTTQVKRRAGAIFEKEQLFLLEEANQKPKPKPELYITESGLLTQTRPDVSTPLVYRTWSPSQQAKLGESSQMPLRPPASQRIPLQPLKFPPEPEKPRRLLRGIRSGSDEPASIFERMMKKERQRPNKKVLKKSEFVEGEAEESDEDEMFGFGAKRTEDDEESGDEDPIANVPNLVDDEVMDLDTLAEDRVIEKVKEHQEQDEAALEKYHRDAIEGKFRSKRRQGVGLDLSDSEDEDDENAARRRKMNNKKRKVDNDTLEDLGKDANGRSFYEAYQADIQVNEDDDFSHLNKDEMVEGQDEESEEKTISTTEVLRRLREQEKAAERCEPLDIENTEWAVPKDDDDFDLEVREITINHVVAPPQKAFELDDPEARRRANHWNDLKPWQKEQGNRHVGTGRSRAAAVTGHAAKPPTSSSTSTSSGSSLITSKTRGSIHDQDRQKEHRKVKKTASILAQIKHGHFDG